MPRTVRQETGEQVSVTVVMEPQETCETASNEVAGCIKIRRLSGHGCEEPRIEKSGRQLWIGSVGHIQESDTETSIERILNKIDFCSIIVFCKLFPFKYSQYFLYTKSFSKKLKSLLLLLADRLLTIIFLLPEILKN